MQMWGGASCDSHEGPVRCPLAEDTRDGEANPVAKMQSVAPEKQISVESVVIYLTQSERASHRST